jgi:hypothetical protein
MKPLLKSALTAVTLSSAVVALAACASSTYRTGYYSRGYVYDRPAYVLETQPSYATPSYVITTSGYVVTNPPATVVAQAYSEDCSAVYRPAYCSYPRYGGTVMINGVAYTGLHFRDGRFGREFWFDGAWHRVA